LRALEWLAPFIGVPAAIWVAQRVVSFVRFEYRIGERGVWRRIPTDSLITVAPGLSLPGPPSIDFDAESPDG
jgi:hypothetical protein